jgi:predicted MFS family arabinose efflux permease
MAIIGMSIGVSFMVSMVVGPIIAAEFGLRILFWMTAGLALLGMLVIVFITPQPPKQSFHRDAQLSVQDVGKIIRNPELLKLGLGVCMLHLVLAATFVVFPLVLLHKLMVAETLHWQTYLPVFILSIVLLLPLIIVAEKLRKGQAVFRFAIAMLVVAELGLAWSDSYGIAFAMLVLFFGAFNFLEAVLPASVARIAPADMKGTAMGLFSSAQFIGAFAGGLLGGLLLSKGDYATTFGWLAVILCLWFAVALTMKAPEYLKSRVVSLKNLGADDVEHFVERASALAGVREVSVYEIDRVAYLKVDKSFDDDELQALLAS